MFIGWGQSSGSRAIKTSWNAVPGAVKYRIYGNRCGYKQKLIKETEKTSYKVRKIKGKKLIRHKSYVMHVEAIDKDGKVIAKSRSFHVITSKTMGRLANITSIKATKDTIILAPGVSAPVKAKYKLPKGRKHITKNHTAIARYISGDSSVAKVDKKGKVTGVSKGETTIYIMDSCGMYCTTKVIVQ